ncbi:MAG TPA: glycosyl hydrolase family 18 protein [Candidatus Sulfotelmatobacter sp.]|nr:glycosyl hydrolase family 18 protein [Candidatus Sulfotelmatobacter sp.]
MAGAAAPQPHAAVRTVANAALIRGASGTSHEIFGFALASSLSDPTVGYPSWNFSLLGTVAFFGLHVDWNGAMLADSSWDVWNSSTLAALVSTAHAKGTKVVLTIVLQDFQSGTPTMCAGLINRATTVGYAVGQVAAKGVDGLNVDYEGLNGTCQNGQTAQSMLTDFARQLRAALPSGSYLSIDTYASSAIDSLGFFDVRSLSSYVDSFFVMAYDLEYSNWRRAPASCSSFCLGPTAPLSGYYYNDTSTANQYIAAVPASKVILGVPYYGRKACVGGVVPNAYPSGGVVADTYLDASTESSDPAVSTGSYAAHRDANDSGQERWDTWYNTSLGCTRELYWDDATSLGAKYDLVNQDGLRGVGIWTLNYGGGAPELWSLLASRFAHCTGAGLSPSSPSQPAGSTISLAASSSGCSTPNYEFWVQYPDGSWNLKQGWGGASFNWNTNGMAPGVYTIHAWVSAGASGHDAIGSATVTLTGCTSASVTPAAVSPAIGSTVSLTATSGGCPSPVYEFWVQYPDGTWSLKQGWGGSTFNWNTTGIGAGTYTVHAWANQQGAAPTLEVYGSSTVSTACGSASVNPAIANFPAGLTGTFVAASAGCPSPQYEFWVQYPDGSWNLKQGWGGGAFSWATSGLAPGTYTIHAWAGSTATGHDSIGSATVTLTGCTSASVTPSTATQPIGSTATFSATSGGCPNPVYEFWVQYPDGTWVLKQGWGAPTFSWNTSGLGSGTYTVHAWANQQGAAPTLEVYGSSTVNVVTPCTSATVTPTTGSVAAGGAVSFTASAAGCSSPMYEFWLLDPAGTWHLVLPFYYGPTWTWKTAGWAKGTYTVHVWADAVGTDTTLHEAIGSATFTVT